MDKEIPKMYDTDSFLCSTQSKIIQGYYVFGKIIFYLQQAAYLPHSCFFRIYPVRNLNINTLLQLFANKINFQRINFSYKDLISKAE